ncbi:MAG: T9SS type A sorting domain-containing protein [Sphingobacteriia bacterium]|jgi:hypothetical protein
MRRPVTIIILIAFITLSGLSATAQISGKYVVGGIGNMGSADLTYSAPFVIEGSSCLDVSIGLRTFLKVNQGDFSMACPETQNKDVQLSTYPNPATDFVSVKVLTPISPNIENAYYISITDLNGKLIEYVKTDLNGITNGVRISVMKLLQGNYILSVYSISERLQSIRFIKNGR